VVEKYGSLDRFYLETDFSKGQLSQILRSKRSPSLTTMVRLAKALRCEWAISSDPTTRVLSDTAIRSAGQISPKRLDGYRQGKPVDGMKAEYFWRRPTRVLRPTLVASEAIISDQARLVS
jgi:transcriptional regulator with XRE-family HTH domain